MSENILYKMVDVIDVFETKCMSPQIVKIGNEYLFGIHDLKNRHNEIFTEIAVFENNDNKSDVNKRVYVGVTNESYYQLFSNKYLPDNIVISPNYVICDNVSIIYSNTDLQLSVLIEMKINSYKYMHNDARTILSKCSNNHTCVCLDCMTRNSLIDLELIDGDDLKKLEKML